MSADALGCWPLTEPIPLVLRDRDLMKVLGLKHSRYALRKKAGASSPSSMSARSSRTSPCTAADWSSRGSAGNWASPGSSSRRGDGRKSMRTILADRADARHRLLPDTAGPMLKADVRKAEIPDWRADVGRALERMRLLAGFSLKELAAAIVRDERQVARWIAGTERPQFDALFAVDALRQPLVVALAEIAGAGVAVETTITVRRIA